ncbi:MAG: universal stress protein [Flavobacteriales bacterium]|nr:universal stress protein [Flavobacteriales bacterium]
MQKLLIALNISDSDGLVIGHARVLANAFRARLRLVHVATPPPDFVGYEVGPQYIRDARAEDLKKEHAALLHMRDQLSADGFEVDHRLVMGPIVETLVAEAEAFGADLIVMGSHGRRGIARMMDGSVSEDILKEHRWPLFIIPVAPES